VSHLDSTARDQDTPTGPKYAQDRGRTARCSDLGVTLEAGIQYRHRRLREVRRDRESDRSCASCAHGIRASLHVNVSAQDAEELVRANPLPALRRFLIEIKEKYRCPV